MHVRTYASQSRFTFTGSGVRLIGPRASNGGIIDIRLNGTVVARVDTYSSSTRHQQVLFSRTGLANRTHTLEVVVTGSRNRSSSSTWGFVDAYDRLS